MITKMIATDWRAMKIYHIRVLLLPLLAIALGWFSPWTIIPICAFACHNFSLNPFAVEEKGALNNLYLTLPIKRRDIVIGRYTLSLIILIFGILMGVVLMPFANTLSKIILKSEWYAGFNGTIALIAISFLLYTVFNLFTFPILFKFGYTKGKLWGVYLPAIFFGLIFGVYFTITSLPGNELLQLKLISYASENIIIVSGGLIFLAVVLLLMSYAISLKLYSKRDF